MGIKYFGRFPLMNLTISKFIFWSARLRLSFLSFRNFVKGIVRPKTHKMINDSSCSESFSQFLSKGYTKINIGGGAKNLKGFVNIDFLSHPNVEREVKANIFDLSFIPDLSVSHIHSNHVMEHMTVSTLEKHLLEYHRILGSDGLLTIRCPNALGVCYGFWFDVVPETDSDEFIAMGFPEDEEFYNPRDDWYHKDFYAFLHWIYGDRGNIANQHLNIFTPSKLQDAVENAGFRVLKITKPETSNIVLISRRD